MNSKNYGRTNAKGFSWLLPVKRKKLTPKQRLHIFAREDGICYLCGLPIDVDKQKWEIEHPDILHVTGNDNLEDLKPVHVDCHQPKTSKDRKVIAKCDRLRLKAIGIKKTKRGFTQWRNMKGQIVRR